MTIQYCSDLHLEFPRNAQLIAKKPLEPAGEILILAGDIVPFRMLDDHRSFFDDLSDKFQRVFWLPGNHEYYHFDISNKPAELFEQISPNVFLVNNQAIRYGDVELIFSTLWSHVSPQHAAVIEHGMNDFRLIRLNVRGLAVPDYNRLHLESKAFLAGAVKNRTQSKSVIITHHVPTFLHYPELYLGDELNEAFASEMSGFIEQTGANAWIYGHHHCPTPEFSIGTTRMLTNQLGYVEYNEHLHFSTGCSFDL